MQKTSDVEVARQCYLINTTLAKETSKEQINGPSVNIDKRDEGKAIRLIDAIDDEWIIRTDNLAPE
ncbi:hypothetical protein E5D57_008570 [Metarhizium anisopliae]|nr:hypothetical protein E5D57_008570 [Metarhizium anisopliae]